MRSPTDIVAPVAKEHVGCLRGHLYLLRPILMYKPKDLDQDWSPRFSTLRDKNGWIRPETAGNLNLGVSRNRFCDFLADPDSRSFSRFLHKYDAE